MEVKQKVKVFIDGEYKTGVISSIEEKLGFRKLYKYNNIHVKVNDRIYTFHQWDVIEL